MLLSRRVQPLITAALVESHPDTLHTAKRPPE